MKSLFVLLALVGVVAAFYVIPDIGGEEDDHDDNEDPEHHSMLVPLSAVRDENGYTRQAEDLGLVCFEPGCNQYCQYYHYNGGRCLEGTCYCWYYDYPWGRSRGASK